MSDEENGRVTWRKLEKGCAYGVRVCDRVERVEDDVEKMGDDVKEVKQKLDRTFWALVAAAVSFGTAAVMLGLNLAMP